MLECCWVVVRGGVESSVLCPQAGTSLVSLTILTRCN